MIKKHILLSFLGFGLLLMQSCIVVRQGEVAVKRRAGRLVGQPKDEGLHVFNFFVTTYLRVPVRTVNFTIELDIPSKEGLTIGSEMSILYRIEKDKVIQILREVGKNYQHTLIGPVFRSALADVSARFFAKDMHSGKRSEIEQAVKEEMMKVLNGRGFVIEAVLMKRIVLPASLSHAIEEKLAAEQDAQRMEFILLRERQEAERKTIEAQGIRDYQKIISQGLTEAILRYTSLEVFRELAKSPNSKVIITDGKTPLLAEPSK
jgi:regulator of protease activity HflC (stomatin/prohibitin superfamily)